VEFLRIFESASGLDYDYPLERDVVTVGSGEVNSIVLDAVEDRQLEIRRIAGGFKVVDLHTAKGTRVNDEWIMQKVLEHGDRIHIGGHEIIFCDPNAEEDETGAAGIGLFPDKTIGGADRISTNDGSPDQPEPGFAAGIPAGDATILPPSPRARRKSMAGPIVGLLLFAAAVVIAVFAIQHLQSGVDEPSLVDQNESAFRNVHDQIGQGYFEAARCLLKKLGQTDDSAMAERVREEMSELDRLEDLDRLARRKLADLENALGRDSNQEVEAAIVRFENTFHALPHLASAVDAIRRSLASSRVIEEEGFVVLSDREVQERAGVLLARRDYSSALKAWNSFIPRDETGREMKRAQAAAIKKKSRHEAQGLISQVVGFKRDRKYAPILALLTASELARFKGTPLHGELARQASEAAELAERAPRRGLTPVAAGEGTGKGGSSGSSSGSTPERGTGGKSSGTPAVAKAPEPCIPESEFKDVDAAIRNWEFDNAVSSLQRLVGEAKTREERNAVSTRAEFVHRQMWFLEDLELLLEENPKPATRVALKTRDGSFKGKFHSLVNFLVQIESDETIDGFRWEEIEPRGIYHLAKAYAPTGEERLNLACFCLNNGFKPEFETIANLIRQEGKYKRSIDSFLGMERGTRVVADFGFRPLNGRLVPHHEWRDAMLKKEIAALKRKIISRDAARRDEGYRGFLELGPVSFDDLEAVLQKRYRSLAAELTGFPETAKLAKLAGEKRKLNEARDHALELIFDSVRYFYPYKHRQGDYSKVQREVDKRVEAVRNLWGNEFQDAFGGTRVKLSKNFTAVRDDLNQVVRILKDITRGAFQRTSDTGYANLLPTRGTVVHLRNFALDETEWESIDTSAAVMALNERIDTSASRNEWEQVKVTNKYRMMMGRTSLAINELILQAARGHSDWMTRTGTFSHFEDTDERRSPVDRMRLAGYDKGSGENIHMGAGSAMGAHLGWYHSSGHHRNMLAPSHTEMACGVAGRYWTQNFGGGGEFSENLIRD
jgi:uncharacterized protein YkwD